MGQLMHVSAESGSKNIDSRISFIVNGDEGNHLTHIKQYLSNSREAYIAVAFLKASGLNQMLSAIKQFLNRGGRLVLIAGQHFALTDPIALRTLHNLFKKYPYASLYLARATSATAVFHPKLYLFRSGNECFVVTGSANFTNGGLTSNSESSLAIGCSVKDKLWIQASNHFSQLQSDEQSERATLLAIGRYERFCKEQAKHRKAIKAIPDPTRPRYPFDYETLLIRLKAYDKSVLNRFNNVRRKDYLEARAVLDQIADESKLTKQWFASLLGILIGERGAGRLWHSDGLYRHKDDVIESFKQFKSLIQYVKSSKGEPIEDVFEHAMQEIKTIRGASVNYVTEMLITYEPTKYAILNKNPVTVLLNEAGVNIKATPRLYNGAEYDAYCELMKEIQEKLNLRNLLEMDSFFNKVYQKIGHNF